MDCSTENRAFRSSPLWKTLKISLDALSSRILIPKLNVERIVSKYREIVSRVGSSVSCKRMQGFISLIGTSDINRAGRFVIIECHMDGRMVLYALSLVNEVKCYRVADHQSTLWRLCKGIFAGDLAAGKLSVLLNLSNLQH